MASFQRYFGARLEDALRLERTGKGKNRVLPAQAAYDILRPDEWLTYFEPYLVALEQSRASTDLPLEIHCIVDDILATMPDLDISPVSTAIATQASARRASVDVKTVPPSLDILFTA